MDLSWDGEQRTGKKKLKMMRQIVIRKMGKMSIVYNMLADHFLFKLLYFVTKLFQIKRLEKDWGI